MWKPLADGVVRGTQLGLRKRKPAGWSAEGKRAELDVRAQVCKGGGVCSCEQGHHLGGTRRPPRWQPGTAGSVG